MIKLIQRLLCRHKHKIVYRTDLVRMPTAGNQWTTQHYWKCRDCGKVMRRK